MKSLLFILASFLLVTTSISSNDLKEAAFAVAPVTPSPPPPQPPVLSTPPPPPSTPTPPPSKQPTPTPPPSKPPTQTPPPSKPPTQTPPPSKPPTPTPPPYKPPTTPAPPVKPPISTPQPPPRNTKECLPLCFVRCKLHSRQNICLRACVTCCDRCKCVPPGHYGNREVCGKCYTDMTTHGGRSKCP